jgi:hypothetical protein
VARRFVDAVNRREIEDLRVLMSDNHRLEVFDEPPLVGRAANVDAWRDYFDAFPRYVVHPERMAEQDGTVAILGHTTGSHLGLADDAERAMTLIWLVGTSAGLVDRWALVPDTPANRRRHGLDLA